MNEPREIRARYRDPLDEIWLGLARRLGLRVERSPDCYASSDGAGRLSIGTDETLDADDSLAQMVLHELCHWLVEGDDARRRPDWGLDNETERDVPREQACLRLQAALLRRHGLRRVLAPTTDFRSFYDALPEDPLQPATEASSVAARLGLRRAAREPWAPALDEALRETAVVAAAAARWAGRERDANEEAPPIWTLLEAAPAPHPTGLPPAPASGRHCGDCAWAHEAGSVLRCRRAEEQRVEPVWDACECHEAELDCRACGACCREGFEAVVVPPGEAVLERHPELVLDGGSWKELRREGERCAALEGALEEGWSCRIYEDRPSPCRELEPRGANCLLARRRAGLTS